MRKIWHGQVLQPSQAVKRGQQLHGAAAGVQPGQRGEGGQAGQLGAAADVEAAQRGEAHPQGGQPHAAADTQVSQAGEAGHAGQADAFIQVETLERREPRQHLQRLVLARGGKQVAAAGQVQGGQGREALEGRCAADAGAHLGDALDVAVNGGSQR